MLRFYFITDTHYYDYKTLGFSKHRDQVCWNESGAIIDAAFEKLAQQTETDIILIGGDLTNYGERVCHEGFVQKLNCLKASGKRVFVITASHDYAMAGFNATRETGCPEGALCRNELEEIYRDFGYGEAIARFEPDTLSYVAQLAPGYRLLCLNTDEGQNFEPQLQWALEQIRLAKQDGQFIFGINHYPVLSPSPVYPLLAGDSILDNRFPGAVEQLADAGLRFFFTGHTHMQNIGYKQTEKGSRLYDINTGALVGYPAPMRKVTIDEESMAIVTESIDNFDWDLEGKTVHQYLSDHFDKMLNNMFEAANRDPVELLNILAGEFSVDKEALLKYKFFLKWGGRFLYRITLGGAGTLLFCRGKIDKSVRRLRIKDVIIEAIRNIYGGDAPYSKETPTGAAAYAILSRLNVPLKSVIAKTPLGTLQDFVAELLYDSTPDGNAVIPLK